MKIKIPIFIAIVLVECVGIAASGFVIWQHQAGHNLLASLPELELGVPATVSYTSEIVIGKPMPYTTDEILKLFPLVPNPTQATPAALALQKKVQTDAQKACIAVFPLNQFVAFPGYKYKKVHGETSEIFTYDSETLPTKIEKVDVVLTAVASGIISNGKTLSVRKSEITAQETQENRAWVFHYTVATNKCTFDTTQNVDSVTRYVTADAVKKQVIELGKQNPQVAKFYAAEKTQTIIEGVWWNLDEAGTIVFFGTVSSDSDPRDSITYTINTKEKTIATDGASRKAREIF